MKIRIILIITSFHYLFHDMFFGDENLTLIITSFNYLFQNMFLEMKIRITLIITSFHYYRDLSNNRITVLPPFVFANLSRLATLIVSYNKLQCIQERAFAGKKSVQIKPKNKKLSPTIQ